MVSLRRLRIVLLIAVAFLFRAGGFHGQGQPAPPADQPAAVVVEGRTLFLVSERILSFSPQERALAISQRIRQLSERPASKVSPIRAVDYETTTEVASQDVVIMAITERDALLAGVSRQELARRYAQLIESTIDSLRNEYSVRTIALGAIYSALSTVVLLIAVKLGRISYRKATRYLDTAGRARLPSLRIQKVDLFTSSQVATAAITCLYLIRAALALTLLYFYVSVVFSFFPQTRGYGAVLLEYAVSPIRSLAALLIEKTPDFVFILVAALVAFYLTKLMKVLFTEVGRGHIKIQGFYPDWADPTFKIVRFAIIALTIAVVLPSVPGYRSPAFQGVSLFVGVLFSLSSTAAVSNIVAGLALTYTRGFQVGDRVQIGETVGDVMEKTLLVTRIRTIKNVDISIPNSLVLSNHMVNFSSAADQHGLILHTTVTIGYDAPWPQVHQLLIDAALATENVLPDPVPFVLQTSLDDSYVSYELNAYTNKPRVMAATYSKLHTQIQDSFNKAGVEIMSPQYSAIRDGNDVTIPEKHRKSGYTPGAFRVVTPEASGKADSAKPSN